MYKNSETVCIPSAKYCLILTRMLLNLWNNNAFISFSVYFLNSGIEYHIWYSGATQKRVNKHFWNKTCFAGFRVTVKIFWGLLLNKKSNIKKIINKIGIGVLKQFGTTWQVSNFFLLHKSLHPTLLTLIGYALGFLVHLLLITILHHDALS